MNKDFNIPYYLFEELLDYEHNATTWENLRYIIQMAVFNNKITQQQADFLIQKYKKVI